jgi:hypothetical protein
MDLDGSVAAQPELARCLRPEVIDLGGWGPRLRLGCTWRRFRSFERGLVLPSLARSHAPWVFFLGSRHFHHLTLALLRRIDEPFNLLVLDAAGDCRGRSPLLTCDGWLRHVPARTQARRIFHVGGTRDLCGLLEQTATTVFPFAKYCVERPPGPAEPLRTNVYRRCKLTRLELLLQPHAEELRRRPLYISLDKSVLAPRHAEVNGPSGHLWHSELADLVELFIRQSGGQLLAMDLVGDWSPVRTRGVISTALAWGERADGEISPALAASLNGRVNVQLLARWFESEPAAPHLAA